MRLTSPRRPAARGRRPRRAAARPPGIEPLEGRRLPAAVTLALAAASDRDGNGVVQQSPVLLEGLAPPGAVVRLDRGDDGSFERRARADGAGRFAFRVALPAGRTPFRVAAGGETAALTVTRGDVVIAWNAALLDAVRAEATGPPQAARVMAMAQLAVADAVAVAAGGDGATSHYDGPPRPGASPRAAAAQAAYRVLVGLYPGRAATFDAALAESLATVPAGAARARGRQLGDAVGGAMLARRADDGAAATVAYTPGPDPGDWVPTPPRYLPPLAPQWPAVAPFVVDDVARFRPGPPPELTGAAYAAAYDEVKLVGGVDSPVRTPDQTALAAFWADLPGTTFTPPGHWNQIAQDAALRSGPGLARNARLFAALGAALADAGICCWDAKYLYDFWRPVTAIRAGDADGNPDTAGDPAWTPLWATPNFASYTSGHSTFSGAAQVVLEAFFGRDYAFADVGDPTLGLAERRFASFERAAEEAGMSRIYGGIHYAFDNVAGLEGGRAVGRAVLAALGGPASRP